MLGRVTSGQVYRACIKQLVVVVVVVVIAAATTAAIVVRSSSEANGSQLNLR
jgi:hypothetical protein